MALQDIKRSSGFVRIILNSLSNSYRYSTYLSTALETHNFAIIDYNISFFFSIEHIQYFSLFIISYALVLYRNAINSIFFHLNIIKDKIISLSYVTIFTIRGF